MTGDKLITLLALSVMLDEILPTAPWEVRDGMVFDASNRPLLVGGAAATPLFLRFVGAFDPSVAKMLFLLVAEATPIWTWEQPSRPGRYFARECKGATIHMFTLVSSQGELCPDEDEPQFDLAQIALRSAWQWANMPSPIDLTR